MHWLASQVRSLRETAEAYEALRRGEDVTVEVTRRARTALQHGIRRLLAELIERDIVQACFAQHDGLLVEAHGDPAYVEALAAMGQSFLVPAQRAAKTLGLGPMLQVLLSGTDKKLVMIQIGPFTLGLLAPSGARLAAALAQPPPVAVEA